MLAQKVNWISEPSNKPDKKWGSYPRWTQWRYTIEGDETLFIMGNEEHDIYIAEKKILDHLDSPIMSNEEFKKHKTMLLALIEEYGEYIADMREVGIYQNLAGESL